MDYKDKYNKLVNAIKVLQETNPSDEGIQNWVNDNVPELFKIEDEEMIKDIMTCVEACYTDEYVQPIRAWLEKQCHTDKIVERAKTEKQRVLITESDGEANIDWDARSLQDVKLLLEYGLDYVKKLDEKNCL